MTVTAQQKPVVCATLAGTSWGHANCGPKYLKRTEQETFKIQLTG